MKKAHVTTTAIPQKLFKRHGVQFAYQFGSSISGYERKDSDIDIAVHLSPTLTKNQRLKIRLQLIGLLSKYFKKECDVVIINDIHSILFKYIIVKEGRLIYSSPKQEYMDFECRIMSEYFDFEPFLRLYNQKYVQRSLQ